MAIGPGWIERVSRPNIERHERSRRAFLDFPCITLLRQSNYFVADYPQLT